MNPAKHIKKTAFAVVLLLGVVTQVHQAPLAHQKSDFSVAQTKRAPLPAEPQTISSNDAAETKSGLAQFLLDATTAKKYAGSGLGLALTKRIVEAQGGKVGVASTPKEGSIFYAVLPRTVGYVEAAVGDGQRHEVSMQRES